MCVTECSPPTACHILSSDQSNLKAPYNKQCMGCLYSTFWFQNLEILSIRNERDEFAELESDTGVPTDESQDESQDESCRRSFDAIRLCVCVKSHSLLFKNNQAICVNYWIFIIRFRAAFFASCVHWRAWNILNHRIGITDAVWLADGDQRGLKKFGF